MKESRTLLWRRGIIPKAIWKTGTWYFGGCGDLPAEPYTEHQPEEYDTYPEKWMTGSEWWAPIYFNRDRTPRKWPKSVVLTDDLFEQMCNLRDVLSYNKLKGNNLSRWESDSLDIFNEIIESILPKPDGLPEHIKKIVNQTLE